LSAHVRYGIGLGFTGIVAGGCLATAPLIHNEFWHSVDRIFGDALIIAFVVALVVEPYLRKRFVQLVTADAVWGFLNPNSPEEYRRAVGELASSQIIYRVCDWTVTFSWFDHEKKYVKVDITLRALGKNVSSKPAPWGGHSWVLASTRTPDHTFHSAFTDWNLTVAAADIQCHYSGAELAEKAHRDPTHDMVYVDRQELSGGQAIPPGMDLEYSVTTQMYRHAAGFLPIVFSRSAMTSKLNFRGDALPELTVRYFTPGEVEKTLAGNDGAKPEKLPGPILSGQHVLVAWRPTSDLGEARPALAAAAKGE
jgi:hypothetical protein